MQIINLTPHTLNIFNEEGVETIVPISGMIARIETETKFINEIDGIPFYETIVTGKPILLDKDGNCLPFPDVTLDSIYVVSGLFRSHFDRIDLWQPGRLLRDEAGNIIGSLGLSR